MNPEHSNPLESAPERKPLRDQAMKLLREDFVVPAFSATAQKLVDITSNPDVDLDQIADVVKLDPGLTAKCLKISNSPLFGGKSIKRIEDALVRIGLSEAHNLALGVAVVDNISSLNPTHSDPKASSTISIDWKRFWMHSFFTAHLTERICNAYRKTSGKEYLAGLLHDVGKIFWHRYFPTEFESVILHSTEKHEGMDHSEKELFDITHAELSGVLCENWGLYHEISRSVRFHHDPYSPFNRDPADPENQRFLATCVSLADSIANMCHINIAGGRDMEGVTLESLPEWEHLQSFHARGDVELDVAAELEKTQSTIEALLSNMDHSS